MHFPGGVLGDPSQDHGHTKPSDYCRVRYSGPTLFSQMSNKIMILLITTSHTCLLVKSFDSALEYLIIICRKIKIPIFQVFAFGTAPHLEDLAGAACIIVAVFAMFAEDTIMAKVPWRFL